MIFLNRWTLASLLVILAAITYGVAQNGEQRNVASHDPSITDSHAEPVPQDLESTYESLIGQAQVQAKNNQFKQALLNLEGIPKNSQHFALAQQIKDEFSQSLLQRADDKYQKGDIQTALAMLDAIAPSSFSSAQAKKLQKDWGEQGEQFELAQAAIAKKDWSNALKSLDQLKGTPIFQSAQVQQILQLATSKLGQLDRTISRTAIARMPASTDSIMTAQASTEPVTEGNEIDNALAVDVKPDAIAAAQPKQLSVSSILTPATASIKTATTVTPPASETVAMVSVPEKEQDLGTTEKTEVQAVKPVDEMNSYQASLAAAQEPVATIPVEDKPSSIQERIAFDQLKASVLQEGATPATIQTMAVITELSPLDSLPQPKDTDNVSPQLGNAVTLSTFTDPMLRSRPFRISPAFNTTRTMTINSRTAKVSDASSTVRVDRSDLLEGMTSRQNDSI